MPLVSDSQLAALRSVAYKGLETEVSILRATQIENAYGSEEEWVTLSTTMGWIREMSVSPAGREISFVGTTGLFRLDLEVDTDIEPGDRVGIDGVIFSVNDTNSDNTIRIFAKAIMRRIE